MSNQILCFYQNKTNQLQIARIFNVANFHFEQVVFSGEKILFETVPEAELQIDINTPIGVIVTKTIICRDLKVLN
ncbi:DUF1830 domain-containing protein [Nostoc sp. CHAB 5844]|nr:DUF1830 domain-containing protein [Nostoc sp. CHAB 5844]